jgi:hypothetical protein
MFCVSEKHCFCMAGYLFLKFVKTCNTCSVQKINIFCMRVKVMPADLGLILISFFLQ